MIRGCPNGETRFCESKIGSGASQSSKPAEVKHLSKRRNRERSYSLSSGERKGRSPNCFSRKRKIGLQGNGVGSFTPNEEVLVFGVALVRGSPFSKSIKRIRWKAEPKRGTAPYLKILVRSLLFYLSTSGNESPEGTIPVCRERLNTLYPR